MAMESAAYFRRLTRTVSLLLAGVFSWCGVAMAQQQLVTSGSIIPLTHSNQYCQIYKILNNPVGDTILLDVCGGGGYGSIYQLKKGSTTFQTVTSTIDSSGTYWNEYMAMDAKGTLYITDRYSGSQHIYRVPYNPSDGTYDFSASGDNWQPTIDGGYEGNGTNGVAWYDNPAKDGSGILFVGEQNANNIIMVPVNADGSVSKFASGPDAGQLEFQYLVKGLKTNVMPMSTDVNGNLYFIENPYVQAANRSTGVYFVPASAYTSCMAASAAGSSDPKTPCISGTETSLSRIDPGNTEKFNGLTLDNAGNVYVGDSSDSYGGTRSGVLRIPNVSGNPKGVTASSFDFSSAEYIAPVSTNANPAIDYRGFLWLPTGTASNFAPAGSSGIPGTGNFVLYDLGTNNLGATPIGTPSATGVTFFTFSGSVTPAALTFSQPGGSAEFSAVATNPYPPATGTTPAVPCTAGMAYIAYSYCQYWTAFTPSGASSVGSVSGQLAMTDAKGNVVAGSTTYLNGIGQGPAVSLLTPSSQAPLSTGLVSPAQVAGDSLGNSYVADPGQGKVLMFAAGTTTPAAGTSIGTGLTAPTGVAVDGSGDVYIADSGQVIEIPSVNGTLNPAGQTVIQSGLGSNLNLAVDAADNVYVADPSNARVVRIYNPQTAMLIGGTSTIGTGFTKPTAVAVDDAGDTFVADGTSLVEINFWGGQTTITSSLAAPVTGLVVDPSGSVEVAQANGVVRIPLETGGLNFNDAASVDSGGVTAPSGIGIDSLGDLYVTASSYTVSSINTTGTPLGPVTTTVNTPNVLLLNGAAVDFGIASTQTQSAPVDVNVYNIGNEPLAFTGAPTFAGVNAADYSIETDGQNPCDPTGGTPIASASSCQLGVTVTAANTGLSVGSMTVPTDAVNMPSATASLEAYSENNLCRTQTTITLTPASGVTFPGSTMVSSTTTAVDPTCAAGQAPSGGAIKLTLSPQAKGSSPTTQSGSLPASGQYSFNLTNLNGGTYVLYVSYAGDTVFGGSSSSRTFTLTVAQAAPTVTLSNPAGITAINGVYYVKVGSTATLKASVTSKLGSPTGTISFKNGSSLADVTQGPVTLDASGSASFTTANLLAGPNTQQLGQVYTLTAAYSGDLNFAPVSSAPVTLEVVPPVALITASPAALTTKAGTPVTSTLTVLGLEGYSPKLGVQLYCDSATLPKYSECTFDVPLLDIYDAQGAPVTSHVTITSNLAISLSEVRRAPSPLAFAGMFGLGLLGLTLRRRTRFHGLGLTVVCMTLFAGALLGLSGCTNSGYTHTPASPQNTTPTGTYNVSIYTQDLQTNQRSSLPFTISVTIQ